MSSEGDRRLRASALIAILAVFGLGLIGWLGWRLVVGPGQSGAAAAVDPESMNVGELVLLAPGSAVELRLLGWEFTAGESQASGAPAGGTAGSGAPGSALAVATLRNVGSQWTEFIVDVAAVDATGKYLLGYGTALVSDLQPGTLGTFKLTVPEGVTADARLGIANLWGRTPGDPQIHPINFATGVAGAAGAVGAADAAGAARDAGDTAPEFDKASAGVVSQAVSADWTDSELMAAASQFAASVAAMQADCRADTSLAGLVCLSRRNFPDYLLNEPARVALAGQPFFHQQSDPTGPPRAFELVAPGGEVACVGQRIDKQTSDQVAILGSCSQRGLYPGDGAVQTKQPAIGGSGSPSGPESVSGSQFAPSSWPPVIPGSVRSSTPVGSGGLPGAPVAADGRTASDTGAPGVGDAVDLGELSVSVDGVQVGLTSVPGLPPPAGTYTLVTITVSNRGSTAANLATLALTINEAAGGRLALAGGQEGGTYGWPPAATGPPPGAAPGTGPPPGTVLPPGTAVNTTVALDVASNQTAATATFTEPSSGAQATISLLPPPA